MSEETSNQYMLLFRGTDWSKTLSPEEMQKVAGEWMNWFNRLKDQGKAVDGRPLDSVGKVVSGKGGRFVADGPFAESKEAIGGFFMLHVSDMDEAVAIAKECPGLSYGIIVEVRPVAEQCKMIEKAERELAHAHA